MLLLISLQGTNSTEYYAEINKVVVIEKTKAATPNKAPHKPYLMIYDGKTATLVECNPLYYDEVKVGDTLRTVLVK